MKNRLIASCLLSTAIIAAPISLNAGMVNTNQLLSYEQRHAQQDRVQTFMAREDVRNQLQSLGVSPEMAAERVAGMTDSQLQQLTQALQDAPAGSGALGIVISVLVIILLLEILGLTDISPKI